MDVRVKVNIYDKQHEKKVPSGLRMIIRRCCQAILVNEDYEGNFEVSLSFVDNKEIKTLNNEYRKVDMETDVLSFPLGENGEYDKNPETGFKMLGDIVISLQRAFDQADTFGHSIQREVAFLTAHSMLHLVGYDHERSGLEALQMREKEEFTLAQLGLSRNESFVADNE